MGISFGQTFRRFLNSFEDTVRSLLKVTGCHISGNLDILYTHILYTCFFVIDINVYLDLKRNSFKVRARNSSF